MSLHLSHTIHPEYLDVVIEGSRTPGEELLEVISIWQEIFEISLTLGILKILSRNKAKGKFPLNSQINMALQVSDLGCTRLHRVACLAYSDQLYSDLELIVNFIQAQGYHGALFKNEEEALVWLLQSPTQKHEERKFSIN